MRLAGALAVLCALCAPAGGSSRTDAASAESKNRRLRDEIEATERAMNELVQLAQAQGIPLDVQEARGKEAHRLRRALHGEDAGGHEEPDSEHDEALDDEESDSEPDGDKEPDKALGEHEDEHEEGHVDHVEEVCDLDTSIMLLGMISFVMILFYLTNYPDDDIRLYSWQITSTTISIFCSVMAFQGFNKFLIARIVNPFFHNLKEDSGFMTLFQFLQCFVYLACIHFGTGIASGVLCRCCKFNAGIDREINKQIWVYKDALRSNNNLPVENVENIRAVKRAQGKETTETTSVYVCNGEEIPVQKKYHTELQRRRQTKALGMLFAHLAGFATIYSGQALQRWMIPEDEQGCDKPLTIKLRGLLPVIINQAILRIAFFVSNVLRECQLKAAREADVYNTDAAGLHKIQEIMKEEVEESETDVSSLSSSFLIVNNIIFFITDYLPEEEGQHQKVCHNGEEVGITHESGWTPVILLYLVGFLMVFIAVAQAVAMAKYLHKLKSMGYNNLIRVLEAILNATGMCFAWCLIWATKWLAKMFSGLQSPESKSDSLFSHEILGRVLLAFILTAFAAGSVFAVDKASDAMRNKYSHDKDTQKFLQEITRVIVNSLGILVGFSWEHSFDGSVEDVAGEAAHHARGIPEAEFQLFLGLSVCILILPAWRDYILEKVMLIAEMLKNKRGLGGDSDEHSHVTNLNLNAAEEKAH